VTTAFADIPFAGFHLEGYTAGGDQQMVSPIYMATDGRFMVLTTEGLEMYSTQAFGREQWHSVVADFNFTTQMFRVYVNNELLNFSGSPDVPFRNTFDDTVSIAEIGFEATWNSVTDTGGLNQFFIDDYLVTRSNVAYAPVPEPASCLAVAGLALVGYRRLRKGRVTAAVPQP
jgi:ligand-binding sensor domain-containing protein